MMSSAQRIRRIHPFYVMELLGRAKQLEQQGRQIVHMEIGEPDFPTPQPIVDAGLEAIRSGNVKYTPALGLPELRAAIAGHYRERYGVKLTGDRIVITPGASGALLLALGSFVNAGDEVLLADPGYPCNRNLVCMFDGIPKLIAVNAAADFQLTRDQIASNWSENTRGAIITSPSNPTGTLINPDQLKKIVHWIDSCDGLLISDEIYHGLEYEERAVSALEITDDAFVINSFSKYFGMTGWRVGWLVVPENWIEAVNKMAQNVFIAAPTHSQYAALAAFNAATETEIEHRRRQFRERRDYLYGELLNLGFRLHSKPRGAFYVYVDCSPLNTDSYGFAKDLLENAGVAVTPGIDFGINAATTHLRFAYTTSIEQIRVGIKRLQAIL